MLAVLVLAVVVAVALHLRPDWPRRLGNLLRRIRPWQVVTVAGLVLACAIDPSRLVVVAAVVALVIAFGSEWVREFAFLMRLEDDAFPGRNDKLIWAVLLIVLPPVGLWLFRSHRLAHWPEAKAERVVGLDEFV